jgi:hypothetical protein
VLPRSKRTPELQALLTEWGYSCFHITDVGLQYATHIEAHPGFWNWLFTTRSAEEIESFGFGTSERPERVSK